MMNLSMDTKSYISVLRCFATVMQKRDAIPMTRMVAANMVVRYLTSCKLSAQGFGQGWCK